MVKVLGSLGSKLLLFIDLYRYSLVNRQTSIEKFSNTSWHKIHYCIWSAFIYLLWGKQGNKESEFMWKASKQRRWRTRVHKNQLEKVLNLASFISREGENQGVTNDHRHQDVSKGPRGMVKLQIPVAEFTFRGSYKSIFSVKFSICPILCRHLCHSTFSMVCGWAPHPTTNNLIYLLLNSSSLGLFWQEST